MYGPMKNTIQRLEQDGKKVIHDEKIGNSLFFIRRVALADKYGMVYLLSEAVNRESGFSDFTEAIYSVEKLEEILGKAKEVK